MGLFDKFKKSSKPKNFKYLDKLIHSGCKEIILDSDILLGNREESKYSKGIKLDIDDLIIDGNGHTIDANRKAQIFFCHSKNITIKNITLQNAETDKGAIEVWSGKVNLIKSTLINNPRIAIFNNLGEVNIIESILNNNGKAIKNSNGEVNIIESTLNNNLQAIDTMDKVAITESILNNNSDGAVYSLRGDVIITQSTLCENTSSYGGAINNSGGKLTISESILARNTAETDGGAINSSIGIHDNPNVIITKSILCENTAKYGGAINCSKGYFMIDTCKISNNNSPNNIILCDGMLEIYNTKIKNNQSKNIILHNNNEFSISIIEGEFAENTFEESIIFNEGKSCTIKQTVFENNISRNSSHIVNKSDLNLISPKIKNNGKLILNEGHVLIKQSQNLENKIYGSGIVETDVIPQVKRYDFGYLDKIIHESTAKKIILNQDITLENYERDFYEGGIELDIDDLIIDGNGKTIDGADKSRIFIITGKNITLKNIIFKNGHSHINYYKSRNSLGGAIKINNDNNLSIKNCRFLENKSELHGGAIYTNNGELTINKSLFKGNRSKGEKYYGGGGAIYSGGKLRIYESSLIENTTEKDGGAIYAESDCELNIIQSTINDNHASDGGGAIDNGVGKLIITESMLKENHAQTGAAINDIGGNLNISKSTFERNATSRTAKTIYTSKSTISIIKNCKFNDGDFY